MKTLNEIMNFYGTDKRLEEHNYVSVYEKILENKTSDKIKILEIGIYRPSPTLNNLPIGSRRVPGASLKTWYDYLPNAEIYGVDLSDFSDVNNDRIKTLICNQESKESLNNLIENIGSDFDLIIDDGGHTMKQHQISLSVLFRHLKSGGIYVIEDLHTCYMNQYVNGFKKTIDILNDFNFTGKIESMLIDPEESNYISENISKIEITMCNISEIAVIYKK